MTENERIRLIRKRFGLTMEAFGKKVGVAKNTISQVESGTNNVSNQLRTAIIREFNVRKEWLETGEGEMEVQRTRNQIIQDFADSCMDAPESFKARFVESLDRLSDEQWHQLAGIIETMVNK